MTDSRPLRTAEFDPRASQRRALTALGALLAFHAWATWGYIGSFYGGGTSWLYEVERFRAGGVPYRDFAWPFPPLGIWVMGGAAHVVGTGVAGLGAVTLVIAALMYLAFQRLVAKVAPGVATSAVITGFVFSSAYAARFSPPLTLGGTSPGGTLGMLFLLVAVGLIVRLQDGPDALTAVGVGVSLGLSALSRHDYWIPVLFLLAWSFVVLRHAPDRRRLRLAVGFAVATTFVAGIVLALLPAGRAALDGILPSHVGDAWLMGFPSVERLVMEVAAASALGIAGVVALWLCFALDDTRAARMAVALLLVFLSCCAIHLGMSVSTIREIANHGVPAVPSALEEAIAAIGGAEDRPLRTALYLLDQRFQVHLFPALMPPIRDLALLMLGLAVALRARRGFAGADWQNVLVEIPAYALFLHLVAAAAGRSSQRAVSMALAILFGVGLYTYYNLGVGTLTQSTYGAVVTDRGTVRWESGVEADYAAWAATLDSIDPGRQRPLIAYGPSGAWNYFFARPNPTRYTRGFTTPAQVDSVREVLRAAPVAPLIVDTRAIVRVTLRSQAVLAVWENRPNQGPLTLRDLPHLGELLQGCREVGGLPGPPPVPLFDCAPPATRPDSSR